MEVWLKSSTKRFRLPVIPSEYTVTSERGDESVNINSIGEVDLAGNRKLRGISWSCFFPYEYDGSYCQYSPDDPREYVELVESMMNAGPVKVIITGTPVRFWTRISSFEWGEHDGSGDIYYSISFREHRPIAVSSSKVVAETASTSAEVTVTDTTAAASADTTTQRTVPETQTETVTVKEEGVSASAVARKYTGSTSASRQKKNDQILKLEDGSKLTNKHKVEIPKGTKLTVNNAYKRRVKAVNGTSSVHSNKRTHKTFGGATGRQF